MSKNDISRTGNKRMRSAAKPAVARFVDGVINDRLFNLILNRNDLEVMIAETRLWNRNKDVIDPEDYADSMYLYSVACSLNALFAEQNIDWSSPNASCVFDLRPALKENVAHHIMRVLQLGCTHSRLFMLDEYNNLRGFAALRHWAWERTGGEEEKKNRDAFVTACSIAKTMVGVFETPYDIGDGKKLDDCIALARFHDLISDSDVSLANVLLDSYFASLELEKEAY